MGIPAHRQIQLIGITTQRRVIQIHIQEVMVLRQKIIPLKHTVMVAVAQFTQVQKAVSITTAIAVEKYMFPSNKLLFFVFSLLVVHGPVNAAEKNLSCKVSGYLLTAVSAREALPTETVSVKILEDKGAIFIFISGSAYYSMGVTSESDSKVQGTDSSTKSTYSLRTYSRDTGNDYEVKIDRVTGMLSAKSSSSKDGSDRALISFSGPCTLAKNINKF